MDKKPKKTVHRIDRTMSLEPQLEGLRPFKVNMNAKLSKERCEKIRKFLQQQTRQTGRSISNLLSQSLTTREVSIQLFYQPLIPCNVTDEAKL